MPDRMRAKGTAWVWGLIASSSVIAGLAARNCAEEFPKSPVAVRVGDATIKMSVIRMRSRAEDRIEARLYLDMPSLQPDDGWEWEDWALLDGRGEGRSYGSFSQMIKDLPGHRTFGARQRFVDEPLWSLVEVKGNLTKKQTLDDEINLGVLARESQQFGSGNRTPTPPRTVRAQGKSGAVYIVSLNPNGWGDSDHERSFIVELAPESLGLGFGQHWADVARRNGETVSLDTWWNKRFTMAFTGSRRGIGSEVTILIAKTEADFQQPVILKVKREVVETRLPVSVVVRPTDVVPINAFSMSGPFVPKPWDSKPLAESNPPYAKSNAKPHRSMLAGATFTHGSSGFDPVGQRDPAK